MAEFTSHREALESLKANSLNLSRTILLQSTEKDRGEEGPRHREWNALYQQSLAQKLVDAGFSRDEVKKILEEFLGCLVVPGWTRLCMLWFIIKNLRRLWIAKRAIEQEYIEEGEPPQWTA